MEYYGKSINEIQSQSIERMTQYMKFCKISLFVLAFAIIMMLVIPMVHGFGFATMDGQEMTLIDDPWWLVVAKIMFYLEMAVIFVFFIMVILREYSLWSAFIKQVPIILLMIVNIINASWSFSARSTALFTILFFILGIGLYLISVFYLLVSITGLYKWLRRKLPYQITDEQREYQLAQQLADELEKEVFGKK